MKRKILTAAMIAPMLVGPVNAANHECYVPMKDWHSRPEIVQFFEAQGWSVWRVRIDDGCYEILGTNADGANVEARINPGNLAIVKMELEPLRSNAPEKKSD